MGRPKKIVKIETPKNTPPKNEVKERERRYFRIDRVEEKKKEGWKVVEPTDEAMKKIIDRNQDLVLMEK